VDFGPSSLSITYPKVKFQISGIEFQDPGIKSRAWMAFRESQHLISIPE
jgi:hypothetical protein